MPTNPAPTEIICSSCKRRQVPEPDLIMNASDAAYKRPRLEEKPDTIGSLTLIMSITGKDSECIENRKGDQRDEQQPLRESAEDELQRLRKEWTSPIYAFFKYSPAIHYVGDRRVHVFECLAQICKARGKNPRFVNRYLDKADARSTSNLRKHVKICWGTEIVAAADKIKDLEAIRAVIGKTELKDGSLAAAFEELERGKPTDMLSSPEINTETRGVVLR